MYDILIYVFRSLVNQLQTHLCIIMMLTQRRQRFIRIFDRFFDMMNTRCLEEGMQKRKPDLAPYKLSDKEDRLKVSMTDISYMLILP